MILKPFTWCFQEPHLRMDKPAVERLLPWMVLKRIQELFIGQWKTYLTEFKWYLRNYFWVCLWSWCFENWIIILLNFLLLISPDIGPWVFDSSFVHGNLQWGNYWSFGRWKPEITNSWELGGWSWNFFFDKLRVLLYLLNYFLCFSSSAWCICCWSQGGNCQQCWTGVETHWIRRRFESTLKLCLAFYMLVLSKFCLCTKLFLTVNRHFGETNINVRSSRSHTIFRMVRPAVSCFMKKILLKIKWFLIYVHVYCTQVIESKEKDTNSVNHFYSSDAIRVSVLVRIVSFVLLELINNNYLSWCMNYVIIILILLFRL